MAHENRISGPCPAEMMHRILTYVSFLAQMGYISQSGCGSLISPRWDMIDPVWGEMGWKLEHKESGGWVGLIKEPTSCGVDTGHAG